MYGVNYRFSLSIQIIYLLTCRVRLVSQRQGKKPPLQRYGHTGYVSLLIFFFFLFACMCFSLLLFMLSTFYHPFFFILQWHSSITVKKHYAYYPCSGKKTHSLFNTVCSFLGLPIEGNNGHPLMSVYSISCGNGK